MANQIQAELVGMYKSSVECLSGLKEEIKLENEDFFYEFDENVVEVVEMHPQEIEPKMSPKKIPKREPMQQVTSPLKYSQRKNYSKVDKDAGLIIVMIDGVKHYECEECGKQDFTSRSRLKTHRQIHTTERNYMCQVMTELIVVTSTDSFHLQSCGSSFKTMNCLKNHSRLHSNIYYNCDMCSSRFKGKHELRCHMDAIHLGKKDHICQICGKAFSRDKTLRQHLMYHLNERNIVCEVCGFKTVNKPKMTRHMKSHTGERNYEVSCSTMSLSRGLLTWLPS